MSFLDAQLSSIQLPLGRLRDHLATPILYHSSPLGWFYYSEPNCELEVFFEVHTQRTRRPAVRRGVWLVTDLLLAPSRCPSEALPITQSVPFASDFVHLRNSESEDTNPHCIQGFQPVELLAADGLMGTKGDLGGVGLPSGLRALSCPALPGLSLCAFHLACQF